MTLNVKWVFSYQDLHIQPLAYFISSLHRGLIISKHLSLVAENVKKSETGGLKDSWQSEPLLTF